MTGTNYYPKHFICIYLSMYLSIYLSIYLSVYHSLDPAIASLTVNGSLYNRDFPLGESLIIECFFGDTDSSSDIQWTLNGSPISEDNVATLTDGSMSRLNLLPFLMTGVYQCSVTNTDGRNASQFVELYGDFDGT